MAAVFIVVLTVFQLVLIFAHWAVWRALVAAFGAPLFGGLWPLFLLLSFVFVPVSVLAFRSKGAVAKWLYRAGAYWLSFVYFLFLGAVAFSFGVAVDSLFGLSTAPAAWGAVVFAAAIVAWAYGIVHANGTRTTRISVTLPNLPDAWKGKRVAFVSDLHLGHVRGKEFAAKVVSLINAAEPEAVFIGGDLYDGVAADVDDIIVPFRNISAPRGIFFICGNHEEFGKREKYLDAVRRAGMKVLDNEKTDLGGIELAGVDFMATRKKERFAEILADMQLDAKKPVILLKHEPSKTGIAADAGVSLMLSGHTHEGQAIGTKEVSRLVYGKYYHGFSKAGSMAVYTTSGAGTWGPPARVGTDSEIAVIEFK